MTAHEPPAHPHRRAAVLFVFVTVAIDMLAENAAGARDVLGKAKPPMTRDGDLKFQRDIARQEVFSGA